MVFTQVSIFHETLVSIQPVPVKLDATRGVDSVELEPNESLSFCVEKALFFRLFVGSFFGVHGFLL